MSQSSNSHSRTTGEPFEKAYTWNDYDFLFSAGLHYLVVVKKHDGLHDPGAENQPEYYSLSDPLFLSYRQADEKIVVGRNQTFPVEAFREFILLDKSLNYPSITLFNFETESGPDGILERVVSLRGGGLGIIDIMDTDPVYYTMMSYELCKPQRYNGGLIDILAVEISKDLLTRTNEFAGDLKTEQHEAICFKAYFTPTA